MKTNKKTISLAASGQPVCVGKIHPFLAILLEVTLLAALGSNHSSVQASPGQETQILYLSGQGKDDAIEWDFFCTEGRKSGEWSKIPVPSHWEFHGFGSYNYGHDKNKTSEQGKYRRSFKVPESWAGDRIRIVFEGAMTDTEVWVNGKSAGLRHQGAFYQFKYDVTDLVKIGAENLLEVTVSKTSSNESVNRAEREADYWIFGGIFRPVYLEATPSEYIDRVAINARANGEFRADVFVEGLSKARTVTGVITTLDGSTIAIPFRAEIPAGKKKITLQTWAQSHANWTAETPNLYYLKLSLHDGEKTIHTMTERFGFRTFEVREGDGFYLNGTKIRLKGVNRHSFWPDSGRCLSPTISYEDVRLIKEMNMNAVRMSHYPPDSHFLDVCDELGLYVLDELAGWQKPPYDTEIGKKLVAEMVPRDVNHPSIIFWDNANEGGWNTELDEEFAKYDPQNRTVLHPWEKFGGVNTKHYPTYGLVKKILGEDMPYLPTEFLHGLYDGGHGAGLNDFWNLMKNSPLGAGGFLWVLCDEGALRTDRNGEIDTDGNHAPDGIVAPYRQKEGSFNTIREIWSPVQIAMEEIPENFDGEIEIENCYDFTNLRDCRFRWEWIDYPSPLDSRTGHIVMGSGHVAGLSAAPGEKLTIRIQKPEDWKDRDALFLTALDSLGKEVWTWTWGLKKPGSYAQNIAPAEKGIVSGAIVTSDGAFHIASGDMDFEFLDADGTLSRVTKNSKLIPFGNGPRVVPSVEETGQSGTLANHGRQGKSYFIKSENKNGFESLIWIVHPGGLLELNYKIRKTGSVDFLGVTFDCPEEDMKAVKWLGDGPYRVWKNRMKGTSLDVWQRKYNDPKPGTQWDYPEFKGYFSNLHWATFETEKGDFTVATNTENLFLRIYTPQVGEDPRNTAPPFPEGDISFLHVIPAIGTKFKKAEQLGPESEKNKVDDVFEGTLYFMFR